MSGASTLRPRRRPPPPLSSSFSPPSTSKPPTPPPPPSPPAETLVYIHPITPTTTLSGVIIAFDTSTSSILRTNSLWPGDPLQSRRSLLIPVDDCRIRGTPLPLEGEEVEEGVGYKIHSRCLLPNGIGPTTIGVLLPKRRGGFCFLFKGVWMGGFVCLLLLLGLGRRVCFGLPGKEEEYYIVSML
ncbi:hypothetical protein K440DRAFT_279992 [Wilcoxina mikolae CBS 423.85]|nr:hypothetical protein K440DRAFT_279992 [Wilcoxina mikolae CBS 423.85]